MDFQFGRPFHGAVIGAKNSGSTITDIGQTSRSHGSNQDMPGTWTITTTPLPAALPLFSGGLAALGLFGWRRKRKNGAALAA
jgi:hypothetical protein